MASPSKWQTIADYDGNPADLTDGELESLRRVWENHKQDLVTQSALELFEDRLHREWAIETGMIENVYSLEPGVTQTLINEGIDSYLIPHGATYRAHVVVARMIIDHYSTLKSLYAAGEREVSVEFIQELHRALLRNQERYLGVGADGRVFEKRLEGGVFRDFPASPARGSLNTYEFCPSERIEAEVERLVRLHREHKDVPPEVEAAWLHHRISQIHPFADGTGRVARALASLVFIKAGWFPLIVRREDRGHYVRGLERADRGQLRPLVSWFVHSQRSALIRSTEVLHVGPAETPQEAIAAVRDRVISRGKSPVWGWQVAKETAKGLTGVALRSFSQTAHQLNEEVASVNRGFGFWSKAAPQTVIDEVRARTVRRAGQIADFTEFNSVVQLLLNSDRRYAVTISFQAIGPRFRGLVGAVAYMEAPDGEPVLLNDGEFLVNYEEDPTKAQTRFLNWINGVLVNGINEWRRVL